MLSDLLQLAKRLIRVRQCDNHLVRSRDRSDDRDETDRAEESQKADAACLKRHEFAVGGQPWTADIDALAVRRGTGKFVRIDRSNVKFPPAKLNQSGPTYTAQCGTLVRIEIDRATGALRIAKAYSVLECGQALVPEIVLGQAQGGFAMGVGYALLETLPLYEDGPGNGKWNLGQYLVARGSDLPLHELEIEVLPPVDPAEHPKGMAEVNMIPVVPALLNAIYDATGHRFRSLPVTQALIKGVLK